MTKATNPELPKDEQTKPTGLALLRQPFPPNQISKLPKESRAQIDERKSNRDSAVNCTICGGWHHKRAVHLDYVGHAALTDRLLDADPNWSWEPLSMADGLPVMDGFGGMWIKLTVCGVSRLGYGHAGDKSGGDAIKEVIGDALRNAAMRFGAALDLWHKGDLHAHEQGEEEQPAQPAPDRDAVRHKALLTPIPPDRETTLQLVASVAVAKWKKGDQIGAYEEISGITEPEEKMRLWQYLKPESALRAFIKKHAQELREHEVEPA